MAVPSKQICGCGATKVFDRAHALDPTCPVMKAEIAEVAAKHLDITDDDICCEWHHAQCGIGGGYCCDQCPRFPFKEAK